MGDEFGDGAGGVRIVKGGTVSTTDLSTGTALPETDTYKTYGSSSNLWGETWTSDDINGSTFGFVISIVGYQGPTGTAPTAQVDHIRITIHYTEASGDTKAQVRSGSINVKSGNIKIQ